MQLAEFLDNHLNELATLHEIRSQYSVSFFGEW